MFARKIIAFLSVYLIAADGFCQDEHRLTVHFDLNQSTLTPTAKTILEAAIKTGKGSSSTSITITGFCDNTGSNAYNDSLSEERAAAVKAYLLENGWGNNVAISSSGKGENLPLNNNRDENERALNRRVELVFDRKTAAAAAAPIAPAPSAASPAPLGELARQLTSDSLKEGAAIILQNMNFHGGAHVLLPASYPVLKELIAVLNAYPKINIEIQGHVCCTKLPDALDNDLGTYDLSVQRAKAIYQYLVTNGIDGSRLAYKGFGSSQRLFPEELNEYEQAMNRRVEIKITAK